MKQLRSSIIVELFRDNDRLASFLYTLKIPPKSKRLYLQICRYKPRNLYQTCWQLATLSKKGRALTQLRQSCRQHSFVENKI